MMRIILLSLFVFASFAMQAQDELETFRRDYEWMSVFAEDEWTDIEPLKCTFVFNINDNGDIKFYNTTTGKTITYRATGIVEEGVTDEGDEYQTVIVLNNEGVECIIQLFTDDNLGVKVIFNPELMIQFF
ncbi:MAG: hypothetical protein P8J32_00540 [bacterium]|nr:hypothetical protein [bacterium]